MNEKAEDPLLGEWDVTEFIFSPEAALLGQVRQRRRFLAADASESFWVEQNYLPSLDLREPMKSALVGNFRFKLQNEGRDRFYQGPDVQGFGMSFGDIFLVGEGVWPRFAYNFRSWSVRLSDTRQLTGSVFYRGATTEAIVFGVGVLLGSDAAPSTLALDSRIHGGQGSVAILDLGSDTEFNRPVTRHLLGPGCWRESGPAQDMIYTLEARGSSWALTRAHAKSGEVNAVGMARSFGPLLYWEAHGQSLDSTIGLEINDPFGTQQFSIRRHFHKGRLVSIEGCQFKE